MEIRAEDYGYDITFYVKDEEGAAIDLSGVTSVEFLVSTPETYRSIVTGVCTVMDAHAGKVKYTVAPEDFLKPGNYVGAIRMKTNTTKKVTTVDFAIAVLNPVG